LQTNALVLGVDAGVIDMAPQWKARVPDVESELAKANQPDDPTAAVFDAGPESLFQSHDETDVSGLTVTSSLAAAIGAVKGDTVDVSTSLGWRRTSVQRVVRSTARTAAGPIDVVQDLLGKSGHIDVVYVRADGSAGVV